MLPRAIVIDMAYVRLTDVTGLTALSEAMNDCRKKRVAVALINTTKEVGAEIYKFGIRSEEMETSAAASYLQQFIVPAEDGRMYVNFKDSNNNSKVTNKRHPSPRHLNVLIMWTRLALTII